MVPHVEDLACHISAPMEWLLGSIWDFVPITRFLSSIR